MLLVRSIIATCSQALCLVRSNSCRFFHAKFDRRYPATALSIPSSTGTEPMMAANRATAVAAAMPPIIDGLAGATTYSGEILRKQDVVVAVPAEDKRAALSAVTVMLAERFGLDDRVILRSLLAREKLGSTGIGHGIAVPHALLSDVAEPAAVLAVLGKPIWWNSSRNMPADVLLALLWPRSKMAEFIPALADFCRLLRSKEKISGIRHATTPAEAHAWIAAGLPPRKLNVSLQIQGHARLAK